MWKNTPLLEFYSSMIVRLDCEPPGKGWLVCFTRVAASHLLPMSDIAAGASTVSCFHVIRIRC
jgi:hypothetical protein